MSDIVLLSPILSFAACCDSADSEWPASEFIGYPVAPQTHVALYEWIRRFVEDQCDAVELHRAESALRELICLDESRVRIDCLWRWHLTALRADIQRRDAALAATEARSRYALYRLVHWSNRGTQSESATADEAQCMRELRELVDAADAPAAARAIAAQRAAEERLYATGRVLEHQTAQLEKVQAELNAARHGINELAEYAGLRVRCGEKCSSAVAGVTVRSPADVVEALRVVMQETDNGIPKTETVDCADCKRLRSDNAQLQYQVLQLQELLRGTQKQQQQYHAHQACEPQSRAVNCDTTSGTCGFDALTAALHRLEETRAECYALEGLNQKLSHTNSVTWSHAESNLSDPGPSHERFCLESMRYEEYLSVLQEMRGLLRLVGQLAGVRSVFLRRSATECTVSGDLGVFPAHGCSLHQWTAPGALRPVRCAVVLYASPPSRAVNTPRVAFANAAAAGKIDVIDLSRGARLGGDAVRFSPDGSYVYICAGDATSSLAARAELRHAAETLCAALDISPSRSFVYFDAARDGRRRRRLGWAGEGICAWALKEMFFDPPRERQRFEAHLSKAYRVILCLSREEADAFAGDCVEIVVRSLNHASVARRLIISERALHALSEENRERVSKWYGAAGCLAPDLATIERTGGYSAGSVVLTAVTHGAKVPPPSACGFLAVSGIGRSEACGGG